MVMLYTLGKSVEGRDLLVTRISTEVKYSKTLQRRAFLKPMVKIVANMHGNEVIDIYLWYTKNIPPLKIIANFRSLVESFQ